MVAAAFVRAGKLGAEFPYTLGTMCYIEVGNDGSVRCGPAALTRKPSLDAALPGAR